MKKRTFILLFFLFAFNAKSQYANLHIKEIFDLQSDGYSEVWMLESNGFGKFTNANIESWQALLDMYRTTNDKAYLIEFAKVAIWVEKNRVDRNPINKSSIQ